MRYFSHTPARPLDAFVDRFWLCSDRPRHSRERILPSGTIEMVINLREDEIRIYDPQQPDRCTRFSGAIVSGPYSRCFMIDPTQHASIIGVHFKPGGAFPFLGVPAHELTDTHNNLEALWGRSATDLRERLCEAGTPTQRFSLLEETIASRLRHARHRVVSAALDTFERTDAQARVRDVAKLVGLSQRRFIQVFADEVGLTPKLYCRIQRFQRARRRVRQGTAPDWAAVAARCGYFDQAHFIRDFRAFSGLSPRAYVKQMSDRVLPNHVPQAG